MKKTLLILSMIIAIHAAHAQWTQIAYPVVGTDTASFVHKIKGQGNLLYICTDRGLFSSSDNGDSWTNLTYTKANIAGQRIRSVYADSAGGKLYAGGDSTLYVSSDNGSTWSATALTGRNQINDIIGIGNTVMATAGVFDGGGVFYSTNGFSTFTQATDTMAKADFLIDGTTIYLAGRLGVYHSTDNGATWTIAGTGFPAQCRFLGIAKSGNTIYAGDVTGKGMYASTDNGATWAAIDTAAFRLFCQIFSVTAANGTVLCSMDGACNANTALKASSDDGATWSPYLSGLTSQYFPVVGRNTSGSCFFTYARNPRIMYRICTSTGIDENISTATTWLSPNPAHSILTVHAADSRTADIHVIDVTGQVVLQSKTANTGKTQMDISSLSAGIYVVQIKTTGSVSTMKFIKE